MMIMIYFFVLIKVSTRSGLKEKLHVINGVRVVCSNYSCVRVRISVTVVNRIQPPGYVHL